MLMRPSAIHERAVMLWSMLPQHLRLERSLCSHRHRTPLQQDFLLNARLTYLQILFLLNDGDEFLKHNDAESGAHSELLDVSKEMLGLVVEVIVLRDRLVNSGTGLLWKVNESHPLRASHSFEWMR